jgi:hypothetical protein
MEAEGSNAPQFRHIYFMRKILRDLDWCDPTTISLIFGYPTYTDESIFVVETPVGFPRKSELDGRAAESSAPQAEAPIADPPYDPRRIPKRHGILRDWPRSADIIVVKEFRSPGRRGHDIAIVLNQEDMACREILVELIDDEAAIAVVIQSRDLYYLDLVASDIQIG